MGRTDLQLLDAHWDHEPFLQKLLIHNETIFRFMGSFHLHVMCTRIGAMNFH